MKKTFCKAVVLGGCALLGAACAGPKKEAAPAVEEMTPRVEVYQAVYADVPQEEVYASTVQANVVNNVVPQSGGRIKKINVEIGDFVSRGQVLAEMDAVNLVQTQLKLANDSTELSRLHELFKEGGISRSDYEAAEMGYKVSRASYENLLENTILRSPISGVVTARNYDQGDMYAMAGPIYVVQQITPVKLLVGVSEKDYTRVHKGDVVSISADALPGRTFEGRVNRLYPTVDPTTHTFTVEILVQNADRALRPGMYASVKVTFATNHSIVVPDTAVQKMQGSGQRYVYVVDGSRKVSTRLVTLGRNLDAKYEILEGLAEGETVVTKGHASLKNGVVVEY